MDQIRDYFRGGNEISQRIFDEESVATHLLEDDGFELFGRPYTEEDTDEFESLDV